jgi:mono/diheme cytochrome c family protein
MLISKEKTMLTRLPLLLFLMACEEDDDSKSSVLSGLTGDEANGEILYDANCAGCHGASAEGASGPAIYNEDDDDFVEAIQEGEGSMPAFPDLSGQNIADIIAFVDTL